tara:strand:+ start:57 stop:446 length:390 start_codon:yes stop_codon:yes gene_type:complete
MINLILWGIILFITITWTVGVVFKPKQMGGEKSWGPVNFKISILWWISIGFIYLTNLSVFYLIIIFPLSIFIVSFSSMKAEVKYVKDGNLKPETILKRKQKNTEALLPAIIGILILLCAIYLINIFLIT